MGEICWSSSRVYRGRYLIIHTFMFFSMYCFPGLWVALAWHGRWFYNSLSSVERCRPARSLDSILWVHSRCRKTKQLNERANKNARRHTKWNGILAEWHNKKKKRRPITKVIKKKCRRRSRRPGELHDMSFSGKQRHKLVYQWFWCQVLV